MVSAEHNFRSQPKHVVGRRLGIVTMFSGGEIHRANDGLHPEFFCAGLSRRMPSRFSFGRRVARPGAGAAPSISSADSKCYWHIAAGF